MHVPQGLVTSAQAPRQMGMTVSLSDRQPSTSPNQYLVCRRALTSLRGQDRQLQTVGVSPGLQGGRGGPAPKQGECGITRTPFSVY